ncbi:hypothetical protein BC830DRAFT_1111662, partial [Chytriomyces sp. MP71]
MLPTKKRASVASEHDIAETAARRRSSVAPAERKSISVHNDSHGSLPSAVINLSQVPERLSTTTTARERDEDLDEFEPFPQIGAQLQGYVGYVQGTSQIPLLPGRRLSLFRKWEVPEFQTPLSVAGDIPPLSMRRRSSMLRSRSQPITESISQRRQISVVARQQKEVRKAREQVADYERLQALATKREELVGIHAPDVTVRRRTIWDTRIEDTEALFKGKQEQIGALLKMGVRKSSIAGPMNSHLVKIKGEETVGSTATLHSFLGSSFESLKNGQPAAKSRRDTLNSNVASVDEKYPPLLPGVDTTLYKHFDRPLIPKRNLTQMHRAKQVPNYACEQAKFYKSKFYKQQAKELAAARKELNLPILPISKRYNPEPKEVSRIKFESQDALIDFFQEESVCVKTIQSSESLQFQESARLPASRAVSIPDLSVPASHSSVPKLPKLHGESATPRKSAVDGFHENSVFRSEAEFLRFKAKYQRFDSPSPNADVQYTQVIEKYEKKTEIHKEMYRVAVKNIERTIRFTHGGGTTGGGSYFASSAKDSVTPSRAEAVSKAFLQDLYTVIPIHGFPEGYFEGVAVEEAERNIAKRTERLRAVSGISTRSRFESIAPEPYMTPRMISVMADDGGESFLYSDQDSKRRSSSVNLDSIRRNSSVKLAPGVARSNSIMPVTEGAPPIIEITTENRRSSSVYADEFPRRRASSLLPEVPINLKINQIPPTFDGIPDRRRTTFAPGPEVPGRRGHSVSDDASLQARRRSSTMPSPAAFAGGQDRRRGTLFHPQDRWNSLLPGNRRISVEESAAPHSHARRATAVLDRAPRATAISLVLSTILGLDGEAEQDEKENRVDSVYAPVTVRGRRVDASILDPAKLVRSRWSKDASAIPAVSAAAEAVEIWEPRAPVVEEGRKKKWAPLSMTVASRFKRSVFSS